MIGNIVRSMFRVCLMRKAILLTAFLFISSIYLLSADGLSAEESGVNDELTYADLLVNSLLPGYWQLKTGDAAEGVLYMTSLPLTGLGFYFLIDYFFDAGDFQQNYTDGERTYLLYSENWQNGDNRWKLYAGVLFSAAGSFLSAYSNYTAEEDFYIQHNDGYADMYGETLTALELLAAPWRPENILNFDFFPAYPMFALSGVAVDEWSSAGSFFRRDTVPFMGADMHPAAAASLALLSSVLLANFSTVTEEVVFRGHLLRQSGVHFSSLYFGAAHLPNMLMPDTSVEDTLVQTAFAALFGYYASVKTAENGYDFRRMIALHFWHNVTAMTLGYIVDPESPFLFTIGGNLSLN